MAGQALHGGARVLVPDENVAVLAAADDEPFIRAAKRAADEKLAARVAEKLLLVRLGLNLDELGLAVALIEQHVL